MQIDFLTLVVAVLGSSVISSVVTGFATKGRTAAETSEIEARVRQSLMTEIEGLRKELSDVRLRLLECEKHRKGTE